EESSWGSFAYARTAMADPGVAAQIAVIGAHNYDQNNPSGMPSLPNRTTQHVWQTEASTLEKYDGSMTNGLVWAQRVHYFLSVARVNAFHYWYLSGVPSGREDNQALTDSTGHVARRAFVIGNWSKFVRPGWYEVSVSGSGPLLVSAFRNQAGD